MANAAPVEFEYRGPTALTAVGSATRRLYWFERPGARVRVHQRDAVSLDGVPNLVRVTRPR
ncbi:MAG TPA: hypothetical protein VFJ20_05995 [Gemmatimonadaceae bacterium]|nr:hypothetical protein [Gemmatimonadaceae bacterium]